MEEVKAITREARVTINLGSKDLTQSGSTPREPVWNQIRPSTYMYLCCLVYLWDSLAVGTSIVLNVLAVFGETIHYTVLPCPDLIQGVSLVLPELSMPLFVAIPGKPTTFLTQRRSELGAQERRSGQRELEEGERKN